MQPGHQRQCGAQHHQCPVLSIDAQGSDLKVATKLNLLRHANNAWANPPAGCDFVSEHTLELKREGIRDDLIW